MQAVPRSHYSLAASQSCTRCLSGYACPTLYLEPTACGAGTFSLGGQTNCTQCPAGSSCPSTTESTQVSCADGTYAAGGNGRCTMCPPGHACPFTDQAVEQACALGTFSLGMQVTSSIHAERSRLQLRRQLRFAATMKRVLAAAMLLCTIYGESVRAAHRCTLIAIRWLRWWWSQANCTACPVGWECPSPTGERNAGWCGTPQHGL